MTTGTRRVVHVAGQLAQRTGVAIEALRFKINGLVTIRLSGAEELPGVGRPQTTRRPRACAFRGRPAH